MNKNSIIYAKSLLVFILFLTITDFPQGWEPIIVTLTMWFATILLLLIIAFFTAARKYPEWFTDEHCLTCENPLKSPEYCMTDTWDEGEPHPKFYVGPLKVME